MGDEWVSVPEAARVTGIPERTLRRYLDRHGTFLPSRRQGRAMWVPPDTLPILQELRQLYEAGRTAEQVEEVLAERLPRTLTVAGETSAPAPLNPATMVRELVEQLTALRQELAAEREQTAAALDRLHAEAERRDRELREWLAQRLGDPETKRLTLLARVRRMLSGDRGFREPG